jgi:acetyl-CoA carboxylase carboxyl transferase subunit alpha
VYYVASPEACAAILWKSRTASNQATEALRITASELVRLEVMDEVIPEPLGGAHSDPVAAFPAIKSAIMGTFRHYENMSEREIQLDRYQKFRKLGQFEEWVVRGADWRNTRSARGNTAGVQTAAGTWAVSEAEAAHIAASVDADEAWDKAMEGKGVWTNKPVQPPGLGRTGIMEMAVTMVEARRRKQAAAAANSSSSKSSMPAAVPAKQEAAV